MSYDIDIGDQFEVNYTSNLHKFFHAHIKHNDQTGLQALHGLCGAQALPILYAAWSNINAEVIHVGETKMEETYNPKNKWGSLIGALTILGKITAGCALYPAETIIVSA